MKLEKDFTQALDKLITSKINNKPTKRRFYNIKLERKKKLNKIYEKNN